MPDVLDIEQADNQDEEDNEKDMLSEETLARGRDTDPDEPEVDQSLIPSQNGWTIDYHGSEAAIKPDESQVTDIENVIHGSYSSLIVKSRSSTPAE